MGCFWSILNDDWLDVLVKRSHGLKMVEMLEANKLTEGPMQGFCTYILCYVLVKIQYRKKFPSITIYVSTNYGPLYMPSGIKSRVRYEREILETRHIKRTIIG